MTTPTGDWVRDFAAAPDQSPWVDPDVSTMFGALRINSFTLNAPVNTEGLVLLYGKTYNSTFSVTFEWWAGTGFDLVGSAIMDSTTNISNYAGYLLTLLGTTPRLSRSDNANFPYSGTEVVVANYPPITGLAQGDLLKLEIDQVAHSFTLYYNNVIYQTTLGDNSVVDTGQQANLTPGWFMVGGEIGEDRIRAVAVSGIQGGDVSVGGGVVARQRPIGRGPGMNRRPGVFRRQQGAVTLRQVLLQLFSAPGIPLANKALIFWTAYNNGAEAVDGPLALSTDGNGYVLLSGLNIAAVAGKVRCADPLDVHKERIFSVIFQ